MASPEETAASGNEQIERCANAYLEAARRLTDSRDRSEDAYDDSRKQIYYELLRQTCDRSREYLNKIEQVIVSTDLLGIHKNELWANDLARTAANALDLAVTHYERIREDYRDFFSETAPEPSPDSFYAMQSAVALYHNDRARELEEQFRRASLPIGGFTNPGRTNTRAPSQQASGLPIIMNKNTNVNLTGNTLTNTTFVVAEQIHGSFKQVENSKAPNELKEALDSLCKQVEQLAKALPEKEQQEVARDLQTFVTEATKEEPSKKWYEFSGDGLIKAATTVAAMAAPIKSTVETIVAILSGK